MRIVSMEVVSVGAEAGELLKAGFLITFSQDAPPELAVFSVLVRTDGMQGEVAVGDVLEIDGRGYRITAVGSLANANLSTLAHAVWQFDGIGRAEKPGEIHLERAEIPALQPGSKLEVLRSH